MTTAETCRRRPAPRQLISLTTLAHNTALFVCRCCGQLTRPARRVDTASGQTVIFRCTCCGGLNEQQAPGISC